VWDETRLATFFVLLEGINVFSPENMIEPCALRHVCEENVEKKAQKDVPTGQARQLPKDLLHMCGRQLSGAPLKTQKGGERMSSTEESNEQERGEPPGEPLTCEQATALQQLLRLQSDIEEQGHQVAMAVQPITAALDNGENVSREMMSHVKAQILKAHLQLDDLVQMLDSIA
jgi:hypothetical protein